MTKYTNKGSATTTYCIVRDVSMDTRTLVISTEVVSRHKTRSAAEAALAKLCKSEGVDAHYPDHAGLRIAQHEAC